MSLLLLLAVTLPFFFGVLALVFGKAGRAGEILGPWGGALSSAFALAVVAAALLRQETLSVYAEWNAAIGASFSLELDALSGFFLLPVFGLSAVSAVFGGKAVSELRGKRNLGAHWFFYNTLTTSMALVVLARNGILFLAAWEIMSLSSFFLVTLENDKEEVKSAGITYLIASQIGAAFLLALFFLLGATAPAAGSGAALDFSRFNGVSGAAAGAGFILALAGFGTKAGIVPLHVWLPEAHPAAPSHVSAVMSGVMIKMGVYGLVRMLGYLGQPPAWWGWTLLALGAISGAFAGLSGLAQTDLKRVLAYCSVENIGIIFTGLGVGLLGQSYGMPAVAALGFCGGLLHVINHAAFKGLLFLSGGAAVHAAETRNMDALGGLLKRMPATGAAFLAGSVAVCGLPPMNGFASELLIYAGAIGSASSPSVAHAVAGGLAVAALAVTGGFAAAGFVRAFGISFLGAPRSRHALEAREPGLAMLVPMAVLAAACVGIGFLAPVVLSWMTPLLAAVCGMPADAAAQLLSRWKEALGAVAAASAALAGTVGVLALIRALLLSRRSVTRSGTWDCGYVKPNARMQYTSSSFAQPIVDAFAGILGTKKKETRPEGFFPSAGAFSSRTADVVADGAIRPVFAALARFMGGLRRFQHGRLQAYVLYIAIALAALLVWRLA